MSNIAKTKSSSRKSTPSARHSLHFWRQHRLLWRWLLGITAGVFLLTLAVYLAFRLTPWPGALLIRWEFNKGGAKTAQKLEKHVPAGVAAQENQQYRSHDKDGYLDVFYPEGATAPLPAVVWVHGGAWVSGDKNDIDSYLKILASKGYATVGVDYSIAPEHQYPLPLFQLNDALRYLQQHAARLHIDPNKIFLAGDSAGSQIVAQMGAIITSPAYAQDIGIQPTLGANKLKGMVLNCGAYDLALADYNGPFGGFLHTVLWAYSGKKDFLSDPALKHASVANYVTKDFPPTFITAGNDDPLEPQSLAFAKKLKALGVPLSSLFYEKNHQPALPHEYQFDLDGADGQKALQQITEFLAQRTR